ncbi:MAG: hypothetical protein WDM88_10745 [Galbitalea sp.]
MTEGSKDSRPLPFDDFPKRFNGSESFLQLMRETIREVYWFAFSLTLDHSSARALTYLSYRFLWDRRGVAQRRGDDVLIRLLSRCRRLAAQNGAVFAPGAASAATAPAEPGELRAMRQAQTAIDAHVAHGSASQQELYRMSVLGTESYDRAAAELGFAGTSLNRAWYAAVDWVRVELHLLGGRH